MFQSLKAFLYVPLLPIAAGYVFTPGSAERRQRRRNKRKENARSTSGASICLSDDSHIKEYIVEKIQLEITNDARGGESVIIYI